MKHIVFRLFLVPWLLFSASSWAGPAGEVFQKLTEAAVAGKSVNTAVQLAAFTAALQSHPQDVELKARVAAADIHGDGMKILRGLLESTTDPSEKLAWAYEMGTRNATAAGLVSVSWGERAWQPALARLRGTGSRPG